MTRINSHFLISNGTAWPDPLDPGDAEWHLKHSRDHGNSVQPWDAGFAGDVIAAYRRLILMSPENRERTIQEIRSHFHGGET